MAESYGLMLVVMGSFFLYFCAMVWTFCNPRLSGADEQESGPVTPAGGHGNDCCVRAAPKRHLGCTCDGWRAPAPRDAAAERLTRITYVNFWDDTDGLLSDCFYREEPTTGRDRVLNR